MKGIRILVAAFAAALIVSTTGVATASAAPVGWASVDVTLHDDQGSPVMLVAGELSEGTALPADVELAMPSGSTLSWIGEVLGGDPANDPSLTHTMTRRGGMDVYSARMSRGTHAQVEGEVPGALTGTGTTRQVTLAWVAPWDTPEVRLNVQVPQGSQVASVPKDVERMPGPTGYVYYQRTVTGVRAGDRLTLEFAFAAPAAPVPAGLTAAGAPYPPEQAAEGRTIGIVVLALAGIGALLLGRQVARKTASKAGGRAPRSAEVVKTRGASSSAASAAKTPSDATAATTPTASRRFLVATLVFVAFLGAVVFGAVRTTTRPQVVGDTITRTFSAAEPCATSTFALSLPAGADPADAADALFGILGRARGVTGATVYRADPRVEVGYCESQSTEDQLRQAMAATGLLAAVPSAPASRGATPTQQP